MVADENAVQLATRSQRCAKRWMPRGESINYYLRLKPWIAATLTRSDVQYRHMPISTRRILIAALSVVLASEAHAQDHRASLRGVVLTQGDFVGIVQGVDSKTYIVRTGDKLSDGAVRAITADSMVILQQVNDPLSLEKAHEVRKVLRHTEEGK